MEDGNNTIASKVQKLGDIELAALLCFVADQHCCIIEADHADLHNVQEEIKLTCTNTFGLTYAILDCSEGTSLDDFGQGILVDDDQDEEIPQVYKRGRRNGDKDYLGVHSARSPRRQPSPFNSPSEKKIADVIIAKGLNRTHQQVQIQVLELVRGLRIFTRTTVQVAPKKFLFIALLPRGSTRLTTQLNDHVFLSHSHLPGDPLPNLESQDSKRTVNGSETASLSSIIYTPPPTPGVDLRSRPSHPSTLITKSDIETLSTLSNTVALSTDVRAYIHDIVIFLRLHRAIANGVTALATRHLNLLARTVAALHGVAFITPSLVDLSVRKIYPHRLVLTAPEREWSLQWGSEVEAVREVLAGVTVEDVIEQVLETVDSPL